MLPYVLLLAISAVSPLLIYQYRGRGGARNVGYVNQKRNNMTLFLFFAGLFLLLALRDISVGTDLEEYKDIFMQCSRTAFNRLSKLQWELGYTAYNKAVSYLSKDYRFFLVLTALITLLPIYKLYSREKRYGVLLIVIFINMPCFLMIFSGLRQSIAISIGILVFIALEKKKYIVSVILVLLAACFHVSALILVLLYPAFIFKIKTKHLLYLGPIMLVVNIYKIPIFVFILGFVPEQYVAFYGEVQETGAYGMMVLFLMFSVFAFVVLDETVMSKRDYFLRNILLLATVFQFFVPIHGLVQRASYYFLIFVPIAIVSIVQAPKKMWKNISTAAVIVMLCFFTMYFFYNASFSTDNLLDVFPYKFYWSEQQW